MSVIYHSLVTNSYPFSDMIVKSFSIMREGLRQTNKMFVILDGDNSINKTETFCGSAI